MISTYDIVVVYGNIPRKHDVNILNLMHVAEEKGLVFNSKKYKVKLPKLTSMSLYSLSKALSQSQRISRYHTHANQGRHDPT